MPNRIAERFGFQEYRMRSYTYLTLTQRRMGKVKAVREETEKLAQILGQISHMWVYESMMLSSRAWLGY